MGGALINYHGQDFELAKQKLKEFSERNTIEFKIEPVVTRGCLLGFTDHNVTGAELNERLFNILIYFNEMNIKINEVINEFGQVYKTFDVLDRDYIQGILASTNAAATASLHALVGVAKAEQNQKNIEDIIEAQSKTIELLKRFKEKLDSGYIQEILASTKAAELTSRQAMEGVAKVEMNQRKIEKIIGAQGKNIELLKKFKEKLDNGYIQEILVSIKEAELASRQAMEDVAQIEQNQRKIEKIIEAQGLTIEMLENFKEKQEEEKQERHGIIEDLAKKVRYAYAIAGGAAILALFELFLLFYRQVL